MFIAAPRAKTSPLPTADIMGWNAATVFTIAGIRSLVITLPSSASFGPMYEATCFPISDKAATVGGTAYSVAGTFIHRIFHSGAWANYVQR